ncbi:hypothetical protein ACFLXT_03890 [Chloroflexota bacterium]
MGLNNLTKQKDDFVCFRCGSLIKTGDRMFNLSVSLDTPEEDGSLKVMESMAVSSLCFGCTSVLLSESIILDPNLVMPQALNSVNTETEEID